MSIEKVFLELKNHQNKKKKGYKKFKVLVMFCNKKEKCTQEIMGTLIKKKWNGDVWFLTVEYEVSGIKYKVTEQLTYKITKVRKIGKIPIGYDSISAIKGRELGSEIRVMYNPEKPKQSYLPDNNGKKLN